MQEFVGWTRTAVKWLDEFFNVSDAAKAKDLTEEIGDLQAAILERNLRNAKKYGGVSVFDALNPFSTDSGDTGAMTSELNKKLAQLDELTAVRVQPTNSCMAGVRPIATMFLKLVT